jgi:hypothetical protein
MRDLAWIRSGDWAVTPRRQGERSLAIGAAPEDDRFEMTSDDADGRLVPDDLLPRAYAVLEFVVGHLVVQDQVDPRPDRTLAEWIALVSASVGEAARLVVEDPEDADAVRGAVVWLACASADSLRALGAVACGDPSSRPPAVLDDLRAHVVSTLMSEAPWRPPIEVVFVLRQLGELAAAAVPLVCVDPQAHGPEPRFNRLVLEVLREQNPELFAEAVPSTAGSDDEPPDPKRDTIWALEDVARRAASAAALLHPGGPVGMPSNL